MERLSLCELSRRLGRDKGGLSRLAARGAIPKGADGKFDEGEVRAALARNLDPARVRADNASQRSTSAASTVNALPAIGDAPALAAYRSRPDLPDDFTRGAVFAAHLLAFGTPTVVACAVQDAGASPAEAVRAYQTGRLDAELLVAGLVEDLGLVPVGTDDAGPFRPTAFGGFDPAPLPALRRAS